MNLLKKTGALAVALTITSFSASADQLDIIVPSGNTGNSWKQGVMLHKALQSQGFDSELHWTKNCHTNNKWVKNNDRAAMYIINANKLKSDIYRKKCKANPAITDDSAVSMLYLRSMALCVAKKPFNNINSKEDFNKWISQKDKIKIGVSDYPRGMFVDLEKQYNIPFNRVDFSGSSKVLKGLIAGDVDIIYTGYTAREVNTPGVNCFATTAGVNGTQKFKDIFPNWKLNELATYAILQGVNMNPDIKAKAHAAAMKMLSEDADLVAYYGKSFIITGDKMEEQGMDMKGFWKTYDIWVSLDK